MQNAGAYPNQMLSSSLRRIRRLHSASFSSTTPNAPQPIFLPPAAPSPPATRLSRHQHSDSYFATVHHISNIVRSDFYLERTLNKLRGLRVTPDLVYRVIRAASPSHPLPSLRFLLWASSTHPSSYRPSSPELDALLLSLAQHRHWQSMWRTAHLALSLRLPLSPSTFSSIISSYTPHPDMAVDVFNRLPRLGCPQTLHVHNSLLSVLVRSGNFHGAYALVRRMIRKGVNPDRDTFTVLVNGWCAAGKLREAREFLEEMGRLGHQPPVRGRDLLVGGLVSAGYLESAKGLVRKMTKEGFLPDLATFNSLVTALCESGEVDFCLVLIDDCVELGMCPDVSTYKIVVPAVAKAGRIEEVFRLLHSAMEEGQKLFPSLYAPALKALCRMGRFADAFSFFDDMKEKGHPPNRPVYTMLVKMCVRGGRFVDAANFLVEMARMGMTPRSQNFDMVVDGLKHCGSYDLAKKIEELGASVTGF